MMVESDSPIEFKLNYTARRVYSSFYIPLITVSTRIKMGRRITWSPSAGKRQSTCLMCVSPALRLESFWPAYHRRTLAYLRYVARVSPVGIYLMVDNWRATFDHLTVVSHCSHRELDFPAEWAARIWLRHILVTCHFSRQPNYLFHSEK